jgi:SAM-dependent methyltransferase
MKCRVCETNDIPLYYTQGNTGEFQFYRCPTCKLVNYDLAGGLDQEKYAEVFIDPFDDTLMANKAQTMTYQAIKRHVPVSGKLLDIGCGSGRLLYDAREDGWEVRGLELSPFLAKSVRDALRIDVEVTDFLEYDVSDGDKYDVVVLRHVLEHLPDSVAALLAIRALLNDTGSGLLEFPNIEALDIKCKRWIRKKGLYRKKYSDTYRPGHCNEFCRESFEYLLGKTGFDLIAWETYSSKPVSNWIFNRWHIGSKARAIIRKN